ncbi:unnamed protein product, partial [Closterium sp. NIES-53]
MAPRRSARLAVPPSFPPRLSSSPQQPVVVDFGATRGGDTGGADSGGAACPTGTGAAGCAGAGGSGARRQETLSPEQLREWAVQWGSPGGGAGRAGAGSPGGTRTGGASAGVPRAGRAGGTGAGGTGAVGGTEGTGAVGAVAGSTGSCWQEPLSPERLREWAVRWGSPGGRAGRTGAGGTGGTGPRGASAAGLGFGGAETGSADTGGATGGTGVGGASWQDSLSPHLPPAVTEFPVVGTTPPLLFPPPDQSQPQLLPHSPPPTPAPYTVVTESLSESREPASRPLTPVRTRRAVRPRPPPVPGTHIMALRPSSVPQRVVLPSPPASSLPHVLDLESDLCPYCQSDFAELVDFAVLCRLDYAGSLVFESSCPPSVKGELALGCDVLEDWQFELECLAATAPHLASTLLCPEGDPDALDFLTSRSNADAITNPPPGAIIVDDMWIFRVKRPLGSPPPFKARYVARGFSQREGVDFFQTFSPTPKMTALQVLLHVAAQCDYKLHSLNFLTTFLQGNLHEAIWLRRPPGFTGLRTTLAALGFAPSTADPSLFLRTDTSPPPFYVLVYVLQHFGFEFSSPQPTPQPTGHSLSAPPLDESVEPSGPYPELVGCLMYLMTCTRPNLTYPLSLLARYVAPRRHRK